MPDDPNLPGEPHRDINSHPPPRPLPNNPQPGSFPPPSFGGPPPAWPPPPGSAYGQPQGPYGQPQYYPVQVNGSQILTMGIVAFFCVGFILGPMAYFQGTSALAAIDRGEADPFQRGNVSAGRICGLIAAILGALHLLGLIAYAILVLAVVYGGNRG